MLAALAVVIVVVAGFGIYTYVNRPGAVVISDPAGGAAAPAAADTALMVAGPLGEEALGDPKAPNVVIEYASMTCPHCQRFHSEVYPEFKAKYIDTGKVYFIFREFPLDAVATSAIMLARCAPEGRYFPIVDLLFDHQSEWAYVDDPMSALLNLLKQAGFTQESFNACLANQTVLDGVNWVKQRGTTEFGVNATPTFFFNGVKKDGEQSMAEIDAALGGGGA
jgi:protein-disulfide isomerase